jgi:hypothetical protein
MEKNINHKSFNHLFGHLWEVELTYRYTFAFKFNLRSQQPDIVPIICHRCCLYWWRMATCVVDISGKFAAGTVDTGGKFATGVVDTGSAPSLANISANY